MRSKRTVYLMSSFFLLFSQFQAEAQTSRIPDQSGAYLSISATTDNGGMDAVTVSFFEIPDTVTSMVYFGIYDSRNSAISPDTGGANNSYFYLIGGSGALSDPAAQKIYYPGGDTSYKDTGELLDTVTANAVNYSGWRYFVGVNPSQGEHIGNKYYFRVVAETTNTGKNAFALDLSYVGTQGSVPTGVSGARTFAYSWSMALYGTVDYNLYPFIPNGDAGKYLEYSNWDFDEAGLGDLLAGVLRNKAGTIVATMPAGDATYFSDSNHYKNNGQLIAGGQDNGTWRATFNNNQNTENTSEAYFWWSIADDDTAGADSVFPAVPGAQLYRTYSNPYTFPSADHVASTAATVSATSGSTVTITMQVVDSAGSPSLGNYTIYAEVSSASGNARIDTVNGVDIANVSNYLVATDSTGLATIGVTDTTAGSVDLSAVFTTNGAALPGATDSTLPGSNNDVEINFAANPVPVASSLANTSFREDAATGQALAQLTVLDAGTVDITDANDLRIILPPGIGAVFSNVATVNASGANVGVYNVSYIDADRTAVIDIPPGFLAGTTNFSGLALATPYSVSSGSLGISWDNDSIADSVDDKLITITSQFATYIWTGGAGTSTWGTAGNWAGGSAPSLVTDDVIVPSGASFWPLAPATTIRSLTIDAGAQLTVGAGTLNLGGSLQNTGTITLNGAGNINVTGALSNTGIIVIASTGRPNKMDTDSGLVRYTAAGGALTDFGADDYYNLELTGTGTFLLSAQYKGNGTISIGSNAVLDLAAWDVANAGTITNTGRIRLNGNAQAFPAGNLVSNAASVVEYYGGTGALTAGASYARLEITGGTRTAGSDQSVSETVLVSLGATFDLSTRALNGAITGFTNNGSVRISGGGQTVAGAKTNGSPSTVEYYGLGAGLAWGNTYHHLTLSGTGNYPAAGNLSIAGNLSVGGSATISALSLRSVSASTVDISTTAAYGLDANGGTLVLAAPLNTGIGLGGGVGAFNLSDAELAKILADGLTIQASGTGAIAISGVTAVGSADTGLLTITGAAALSFTGTSTYVGGLTASTTLPAGISLGGVTELIGGALSTITLGRIGAGANALTLTADDIDFSGGAASVTGSGALAIRPVTLARQVTVNNGLGGTLSLQAADMAAMSGGGFSSLTIGRADGTGLVEIAAALNFSTASLIIEGDDATPDLVRVDTNLTNSAAGGSISFRAPTRLGADVTTTAGLIEFQRAVTVRDGFSPAVSSGAGAGNISFAAANGTINGTAGGGNEALSLNAGTGAVSLGAAVGGVATLHNLTITSGAALALQNITLTNDFTLTVGGAAQAITQTAATALIVPGTLSLSASGLITLAETGNAIGTLGSVTRGGAFTLYDSVGGLTVTGPITGGTTTNIVTITVAAANLAINGNITASTAGGGITLVADGMAIGGAVNISAGAGPIALYPFATGTAINLGTGVGGLDLSDAELDRVFTTTGVLTIGRTTHTGLITISGETVSPANAAGGIALVNRTGGIAVDSDLTAAGGLSLTANGGPVLTGAILGGAGILTTTTGNIVLNAATGIGDIGTLTRVRVNAAGTISATNTTLGDLFLAPTGNATVGVAGFSLSQWAGGALRVDAGGNLTVGGDVNTGAGSLELNAVGTITRTAGTLTAATLRIGASGTATTIGISAATRILTAATTLLDARASTGVGVFIQNTGNVNVTAQATAGAIDILNTGTTTSSAGGLISGTTVTVSSSGALNIGHALTGPTGVSLAVTGAGGLFSHTAGIMDGTDAPISIVADDMSLAGAGIGSASADIVTLRPQTGARVITIGADTVGTLGLTDAELDTVAGTLVLGATTHAGNIVIDGGTSRTGELELATTGQISTAAGTIDADSLLIRAVGNVTLTSAVSNLAATHIGAVSPSMAITNTKAGGLTVTTVRGVNGIATNGGNLTLVETLGAMNVSQAIVTGAGTLALTLQRAGALLSTNATGTLSATNAALTLTADDMALAGAIGAGNGRVILRNYTAAQPITLGAAGGGSLSLLAAELDQVTTTGVLELGRNDASASALVTVGGPIGPANATILAITTGGGIAGAGQTITETSLALRAAGAINVSIAATTVAATTTTSGVAIASAGGFSIGTIDGLAGVSSQAGQTIELSSGAAVTQLQPLNAGVAGGLRLSGTGPYTLTALGNQIGTLAANLSGAGALLSYSDADAFAVGTVGVTNGIATAGGNVTLDTQSGTDISLSYGPTAIDTGIGGGTVTLQDPVLLMVSTAITTGGGAGDIVFNSSLRASAADAQDLSLTAGLGSISFFGIVGATRLGDLTVVSASGVSANFSLAAASVSIIGGGAVDLNGAVTAPGGFSSSGTSFDNTGATITTMDSPITLSHTALVTIGATLSSGTGNIDIDSGAANTSFGANTTTTGGAVRFRSPLILATDITVSSGAGNVTFDGTIIAAAANTQGLTINTTGTTRFNGSVGGTRLKHLATNALGTTELNAASFSTGGAAGMSFGDNVSLIVDASLDASALGPITVAGSVSGVSRILTLANASSATFTGSVGSAGNLLAELTLAATISTAGNFAFNGGLYATAFTVNAGVAAYGVTLGGGGQVTNLVTFNNTGSLTISSGFVFTGGARKTTIGIKTLAGIISASDADLDFGTAGSVTISGDATLNPGIGTITLTGVATTIATTTTLQLGAGGASTINTGTIVGSALPAHLTINTTGIATLGAIGTNIGTVTVQQSGGTSFASLNAATFAILDTAAAATVSVSGNLTVGTAMSAAAGTGAYNVSILGPANTIAGTTSFANTGALTVQGTTQFTLGANKLAGAKNISGTITATGASNLNFGTAGTVTITSNASFGGTTGTVTLWDTVINDALTLNLGNGAATIFTVRSVSGQAGGAASNLIIQNLGANATIANAVGPLADIGTVTVTKSGGTASFQGNFEASSLLPGAGAYSLSFAGAVNQVSGAVTFLNSGNTAIGDQATDSFLFDNGVTATSGPKSIAGYLRTSNDAIAFQTTATTLSANAFIETGSAVADFGAVSDGGSGYALTLHANVAGSTGTITFNGLVTLGDLVSYARPYAVVMNAGSDIVQQVAFLNTGNLTLGDAVGDDFRFRAGVSSLSAGTNTFQGTVRTDGGNTQDIALDDLTVGAGNLTLNAGTGAANTGRVDISVLAAIGVGQILDVASSRFDINEVSNDGTLRLNGLQTEHIFGTMDLDSGVTEYYGSVVGQVFNTGIGAAGNRYYDLRINANAGVRMEIAGDIEIIRDLRIQSGRLDADAFDANIVVDRHWQNDVGFTGFIPSANLARSVSFTHTAVEIRGDNEWFIFVYLVNDGVILFENSRVQRVLAGGIFRIRPISNLLADTITLSRLIPGSLPPLLPDAAGNPSNPPVAPGEDGLFWFFELEPTADFDMRYVEVYYSNARQYPISVPADVTATPYNTHFSFKWLDFIYAIYSFVEDEDYNGRIDRIRVTVEGPINGNFSGFMTEVVGYEIDTGRGTNGYLMPVSPDPRTFYIYLKEKPYLDTNATPDWRIVSNSSLQDAPNNRFVGNLSRSGGSEWMTPGDGAWPIIGYTLTVPLYDGSFIHFSEPVVRAGGASIDDTDFVGATGFTRITGTAPATAEAIVNLGIITLDTIRLAASNFVNLAATVRDLGAPPYWEAAYNSQVIGPDAPRYPPAAGYIGDPNLAYAFFGNAPPLAISRPDFEIGRGSKNEHRVSDLLISVPPTRAGVVDDGSWSFANKDSWFVWPIWAWDRGYFEGDAPDLSAFSATLPGAGDSASLTVGLVRTFDGTQWLRDQDIWIQSSTTNVVAVGTPELLYDSNVAAEFRSVVPGIWLPSYVETNFSGLAAKPNTGVALPDPSTLVVPFLWNNDLPAADAKIYDRAVFEFWYRLSGAPADLYAGRLEMASTDAAIPANWYRLVRPFGFAIRDIQTQRSGVSILNNVIDPTRGERTRLNYIIDEEGPVTITVFTLDGDVVQTLQRGRQSPGDYTVNWDGRNRAGNSVARGIYFIRIVAPGIDEIRKVMVVKN